MTKTLLVTGGAGYIGSHAIVEFTKQGYQCVIVDNFSNSSPESIKRQEKITGKEIPFYNLDILDKAKLDEVFVKHKFDAVVHFAGYKAVGESVSEPLKYYHNNIGGTITLLQCMREHNVNKLIFSSSATVYGDPQFLPLTEQHPLGGCSNPYGNTKYMIELMLKDVVHARPEFTCISLRYFNPVGAHESGLIGEDPRNIPTNLMPYLTQVAVGRREQLSVFGNDYPTHDGTGVRDYIHVVDLAFGHVMAMKCMEDGGMVGYRAYNLGCGQGHSVLDMLHAMEKATGRPLPHQFAPRRQGDVASCYANSSLAERELQWTSKLNVDRMCADAWRFQTQNPMGYQS